MTKFKQRFIYIAIGAIVLVVFTVLSLRSSKNVAIGVYDANGKLIQWSFFDANGQSKDLDTNNSLKSLETMPLSKGKMATIRNAVVRSQHIRPINEESNFNGISNMASCSIESPWEIVVRDDEFILRQWWIKERQWVETLREKDATNFFRELRYKLRMSVNYVVESFKG